MGITVRIHRIQPRCILFTRIRIHCSAHMNCGNNNSSSNISRKKPKYYFLFVARFATTRLEISSLNLLTAVNFVSAKEALPGEKNIWERCVRLRIAIACSPSL